MHIHIHIHHHTNDELLKSIYKQNKKIIMTQAELAEQMNEQTAKITKIGTESTKTLEKVAELEEALNNQDNVSPELQAAFDNLKAQVTVVDDLIPDAPVEGENSGL
jgi:septal ring factor EnvC (AmiA/AmiB activator)